MTSFTESVVEQAALAWLESVGWQVRNGAEIAPGEPAAERDDYGQAVLAQRLRDALPHASFIGFTGTPIELKDANTRAVFDDYISVYDIQRAVQDGATVPIYYESRLAKLALDEAERPKIDPEFEEATEGEEVERKEKLKTKWAQLEAVVGAEKRLKLVAQDIVEHFEKRLEAMDGKAMIVCMSRRICVGLYRAIVKLRPDWDGAEDERGALKVVMTGSASDPADWQPHIRNKPRREALANRFRDPKDPVKLVLVRDMWLTGFDAPSLHTMYVDKPMRGHGLMQAIARVNRVFKDKPGGLVVDSLPEPRHRSGPGDRRADRAREGGARGQRPRRCTPALGGRTCFLRRAGDERQRGEGSGRRDAADHRAGTRPDCARQRHDRLDAARERPGSAARAREADPATVRLSARQAGEGDRDRAGAGRSTLRGMDGRVSRASNDTMQLPALRAAADAGRH